VGREGDERTLPEFVNKLYCSISAKRKTAFKSKKKDGITWNNQAIKASSLGGETTTVLQEEAD